MAFDRGYPDISKLPPPAGEVLSQYKLLKRAGCQVVTTGEARALLQALAEAGISPSRNHVRAIGFDLGSLPGHLTPRTSTCTLPFQTG
jgi:hypothetical protein